MQFVRMEMKTVVATILRRFELELVSDSIPDLVAISNLEPGEPIDIETVLVYM